MDSWFTHAPLINDILQLGLDVIGMVKLDNKRYLVNGQLYSAIQLHFPQIVLMFGVQIADEWTNSPQVD